MYSMLKVLHARSFFILHLNFNTLTNRAEDTAFTNFFPQKAT